MHIKINKIEIVNETFHKTGVVISILLVKTGVVISIFSLVVFYHQNKTAHIYNFSLLSKYKGKTETDNNQRQPSKILKCMNVVQF